MNGKLEIRDLKVEGNNSVRAVSFNVVSIEDGKEILIGNFCKFGLNHNSPQDLVNYASRVVNVVNSRSASPYPRKPASYC